MDIKQAQERLTSFLQGKELTFTIENFDGGEWIATCNEMPEISTGGMNGDITQIDIMIRDVIATAAGLESEWGKILKFVGFRSTVPEDYAAERALGKVPNSDAFYVVS